MRPTPARVLLSLIMLGALVTGALTSQFVFFAVGLGAGVLLATSLSTSRRPLTRALEGFRGRAVEIRVWGAPPPDVRGSPLVVTAVNALGAGAHVFFEGEAGASAHLKVAQPTDVRLAVGAVVIGSARYVQWNGRRLPHAGDAPAVTIALCRPPDSGQPGGAA